MALNSYNKLLYVEKPRELLTKPQISERKLLSLFDTLPLNSIPKVNDLMYSQLCLQIYKLDILKKGYAKKWRVISHPKHEKPFFIKVMFVYHLKSHNLQLQIKDMR